MPGNAPPVNQVSPGYWKNLQSYFFLPLRKEWEIIMKESGYFNHGKDVATFYLQPMLRIPETHYPAIFITHPHGDFERHGLGSKQWRVRIGMEVWKYTKHFQEVVNNELDQFVEGMTWLLSQNSGMSFPMKIGNTEHTLCVPEIEITGFDNEYNYDNHHIYRTAMVSADFIVAFPTIAPPIAL